MNSSSMELGAIGIWTAQFDYQPAAKAREAAAELEQLGFGAIWFPESVGRESLTNAALLLGATSRIVIATGIANIYARDPVTMAAGQKTLAEAYPGRFLLGLGVSHIPLVEQVRGHRYGKPVASMRAYLDGMDRAPYRAVPPSVSPIRVLAALGPKMLRLAAERAGGAHPYFVPPEHTARAREILGSDRLLAVEQAVVLETDSTKAREIARAHASRYLALPNYANNLRRLGFGDEDLVGGGSNRLVDAIVAWGDMTAVIDRVRAHQSAGANHVCVQVLPPDPQALPIREWREVASALLPSK
ncbi:MAG: LLM class F420-dependent oxidoreductase [Deltaproteobacteria bacterium RIFCSPLOWO2_12_FULL_57_22]|nr:MAG: LLM class F420-dependent oxidoreductase [Deltaproteobacteria bacterium RIFCSPLOWO2_12_FULL_57_22]